MKRTMRFSLDIEFTVGDSISESEITESIINALNESFPSVIDCEDFDVLVDSWVYDPIPIGK